MTADMCISVVWVAKKKKSRPTDPFFSRHVTVNTTFLPMRKLLYAYFVLMEFPGQELDLSMPEGREFKGDA